jgi:hypothetical protein
MRRWREASAKVLYECDWMIVCMLENMKINKKKKKGSTCPELNDLKHTEVDVQNKTFAMAGDIIWPEGPFKQA